MAGTLDKLPKGIHGLTHDWSSDQTAFKKVRAGSGAGEGRK